MKKFISILLLITISSTSFVVAPKPAEAQFTDFSNLLQNTWSAIVDGKQIHIEVVLNKLALKVAKKILDRMTDSIIVWAGGGFKKEGPAFVSNFKDFAANTALETGTLLIDDLVAGGERYASRQLTAEEQLLQKKCTESKKEYTYYYDTVKSGLLKVGIQYNGSLTSLEKDGVLQFNNLFINRGYPIYVLNNQGGVNDNALRDFIENEILLNPLAFAEAGLKGDVNVVAGHVKTIDKCRKTLWLKVAGLTYTNELVKFVGSTYREGRKGSASRVGIPDFDNFGPAYIKSLSDNWHSFKTDASRGGWQAWDESAKLQNTPWGAKYLAQVELSDSLAQELGQKTAEIQRSGGFLDKGECLESKTIENAGGTEEVCLDYQGTTPGSVILESINRRATQPYDQLNNVEKWSDLLLTTGVKLVAGVLDEGVLPLANNAIDKGLSCLAGECDDDAFGESSVASSQTITNSGTGLDDVVDIKSVLYGPMILEKDQNGNVIYERTDADGNRVREKRNPKTGALIEYVARAAKDGPAGSNIFAYDVLYKIKETYKKDSVTQLPVIDSSGKKVVDKYVATKGLSNTPYTGFGSNGVSDTLEPLLTVDYTAPQYALEYEQDANGAQLDQVRFETHPITGAFTFDNNGKKVLAYKREKGALFLVDQLQTLLNRQNSFIRNKGVNKLMELDHALPGPDLGWDDRLKEKGQQSIDNAPSSAKSAHREIFEKVKRTFEDGVNGDKVDDPSDVVMVLAGSREIFTNPYYGFHNFNYPLQGPGKLKFASNGSIVPQPGITAANYQQYIDASFPKQISLIRSDRDSSVATNAETFNVANMNTYPGLWFNPDTSQVEAIGNIPDAQDMRELALAVQTQYTSAIDTYKRRGDELRVVQVKLKELQRRYESLNYLPPTAPLEDRVERNKKEDEIAYEISLIRDRLPVYDEVTQVITEIKDVLVTYDRMGEMIEGTDKYRSSSGYANRFGDLQAYRGDELEETVYKGANYYAQDPQQLKRYASLFLKDKMGLLYCALQDQAALNAETPAQKRSKLAGLLNHAQDFASLVSPTAFLATALGFSFGTSNEGYLYINGNKAHFNPFGGLSASEEIKKKWLKSGSRMEDTYSYFVPYRCYETSVSCKVDGDPGCGSYAWECPYGAGHNDDDAALLAAMPIGCKSIYGSSLGDYLKLIDPDSGR